MNPNNRLSSAFVRDHADAAARVLEGFAPEDVASFLATVKPVTAAQVIMHFTPGFAASCVQCTETTVAGRIFAGLPAENQIMLLRQLDRDKRESLLDTLKPDLAASLQKLLPYSEGTAGALMETLLVTIPEGLSIRDAVKRVKRIRRGMKFYVYVTNAEGQLSGVLTLHELINSQPASLVSDVMHKHVLSLSPEQPVQSVIDNAYWQEYYALPVTDENNVLLGVIRQKSVRRLQEHMIKHDAVSDGLGTFITVGELFSRAAAFLLTTLIATGASPPRQNTRD